MLLQTQLQGCESSRFLRRRTQLQGYETERSEMERWKILHSAKDLKQKRRNV